MSLLVVCIALQAPWPLALALAVAEDSSEEFSRNAEKKQAVCRSAVCSCTVHCAFPDANLGSVVSSSMPKHKHRRILRLLAVATGIFRLP